MSGIHPLTSEEIWINYLTSCRKCGQLCLLVSTGEHGLSATDEERGFVDNYKFLYEDLIEFVKYVRAKPGNADLPLFIFCHSLGTVITTLALPKIEKVTPVIFNGAAFNPGYASASPFGLSCLFPLTLTPTAKMIARAGAANDPRGYVGRFQFLTLLTMKCLYRVYI